MTELTYIDRLKVMRATGMDYDMYAEELDALIRWHDDIVDLSAKSVERYEYAVLCYEKTKAANKREYEKTKAANRKAILIAVACSAILPVLFVAILPVLFVAILP